LCLWRWRRRRRRGGGGEEKEEEDKEGNTEASKKDCVKPCHMLEMAASAVPEGQFGILFLAQGTPMTSQRVAPLVT
jgi:hypothetical protein